MLKLYENFTKFISIRLKLVFLLSISAFLAVALSSLAIFIYTLVHTKETNVKHLSHLTKIIGENLILPLKSSEIGSIDTILTSLMSYKDIKAVYVFKQDKLIVVKESDDKKVKINLVSYIHDRKKSMNYIDYNNIIINYPIKSNDKFIGSICVISDTSNIKNTIVNQVVMGFIVVLIVLILIILFAFKIQKIFTDPILELTGAMENFSITKKFSVKINTNKSNDEFKYLFEGFNRMITTINIQTKELENIYTRVEESIEYASIIQGSLIPDNRLFREYFQDYFVIWHPKDIVGGDIYLFDELGANKDECLIMVIDCTGHGVHGAFVTMLVKAIEYSIVNKVLNSSQVVSPAKILEIFNRSMKHILKQEDVDSISNVGFDGGVLYYNKKNKLFKYAGAKTKLFYIYKNEKIEILDGDKYSIGYKKSDKEYIFSEYEFEAKEGMNVYMATDGYSDQLGGKKGFPLGVTNLLKIIDEVKDESCADQQEILLDKLALYQGDKERVDDVTIIGFKV